jgi:hypothetical protein
MLGQAVISHPPPIQDYAVRHGTRLRFIVNSAFQGGITYQNLLDTMLFAVTNILGYDLFYAVKIRRVSVWATPVIGNAVTVAVDYIGATVGASGDQRFHTDTSMGVQPACVRAKPSPKSQASLFQLSSSNNAFLLTAPAGAVVDVELTYVQSAILVAVAAQNALAGASVGGQYWRGLDGLAAAASKFTPVVDAGSVI